MGQITETIRQKLLAAFDPSSLEVIDESEKHRGHAGYREGGETHFRVEIVAAVFESQSRLDRQRAVNEALREELAGPVHALAIKVRAPSDPA
jgi:BolA protein